CLDERSTEHARCRIVPCVSGSQVPDVKPVKSERMIQPEVSDEGQRPQSGPQDNCQHCLDLELSVSRTLVNVAEQQKQESKNQSECALWVDLRSYANRQAGDQGVAPALGRRSAAAKRIGVCPDQPVSRRGIGKGEEQIRVQPLHVARGESRREYRKHRGG